VLSLSLLAESLLAPISLTRARRAALVSVGRPAS
jgi:hypothetical protein